jgi:homoserine O-acetyltransferase
VESTLESIGIPVLVVSIDSDGLYPPAEQEFLAHLIPDAELYTIHSPHGHDAFLIETAELEERLRAFREAAESRNIVKLCAGGAA